MSDFTAGYLVGFLVTLIISTATVLVTRYRAENKRPTTIEAYVQGEFDEQERIIDVVLRYKVPLRLEGASDRDKMAMAHAIWVFRHGLAKAIKGEGENK